MLCWWYAIGFYRCKKCAVPQKRLKNTALESSCVTSVANESVFCTISTQRHMSAQLRRSECIPQLWHAIPNYSLKWSWGGGGGLNHFVCVGEQCVLQLKWVAGSSPQVLELWIENWWELRACADPWRVDLGIILLGRVLRKTSKAFDARKFCLTYPVSFLRCSFVSKKIKVNPLCQTAHDEIQQVGNGQAQPLQHNPTKAQWWADCISNTVASCECELPLVGEVFGVALKCTADEVGEPFVIIA